MQDSIVYEQEFLSAVRSDFAEHNHVLGVAATGSGKTILASELMRDWKGNCLFLADAQELVHQNADKYQSYSGEIAAIEMADSSALIGDRVVIATTQSICRRLEKWPRAYFSLIIVDEAHRKTEPNAVIIRLHVGLEDTNDLIADLNNAFSEAHSSARSK